MPAPMTPEEVDAFIDSRPGWIMLTTIGRDGYPHTVPIGYFRMGEDIYIGCRRNTQKLKNIERNPKVSLLLEAGNSMQTIKGVMLQGDARVLTAPEDVLPLLRESSRRRGVPEADLPTEVQPTTAYIHVRRRKVISWDYSKS